MNGLDGLRGAAVALVVLAHSNVPIARYGGIVGVSLFFVLSGFLITSLLVGEHRSTGRVALGAFYARRALRLLPAMLFTLAGGVALTIAFTDTSPGDLLAFATVAALYVGNLPLPPDLLGGPFAHFWTLAMEAQFYLAWPVVLALGLRTSRRGVVASTWLLALGSLALRFVGPITTHSGYRASYYLPHTNVYSLLAGSAAALALDRRGRGVAVPRRQWNWALAALLVLSTVPGLKDGWREADTASSLVMRLVAGPLAAGAAVVVVVGVVTGTPTPGWLTHRTTLFLGRISYGLYLWHETLDWIIGGPISTGLRGLVAGTLAAALAVPVAVLSWRYVEVPFLRIKTRFERGVVAGPTG